MIEKPADQENIGKRLNGVMRAWTDGAKEKTGVAVTTTGGMPQLKPIIERIPAARVGQDAVKLLEQPEFERKPVTSALDYQSRWPEREALRFHCAEALRKGDYAAVYGIASRYGLPWGPPVRNCLGPLLELPYHGAFLVCPAGARTERRLASHELHACQVEARLQAGDVIGAVVQLHVFLESAVWQLIARNERLRSLGLAADADGECLQGCWPGGGFDALLEYSPESQHRLKLHRVVSDTGWPTWLTRSGGDDGYRAAAKSLEALCQLYNRREKGSDSIRRYRNRLVHGAGADVDLGRIGDLLLARGLRANGEAFGENFLRIDSVQTFLSNSGAPGLGGAVRQKLDALLTTVIEG